MEDIAKKTKTTSRPTNWERVNALSSLALALISVGAIGIGLLQIHEMREEARIEHLTVLVDKWDSAEWTSIRKSLAQQRVDKTTERLRPLDVADAPVEFYDELNFCDDLGLLTSRGYLDIHDVWNDFGDVLFKLYADARPLLDSEQKNSPAEYRECTNMVETLRLIEKREDAGSDDHPTEQDLYSGYIGDLASHSGRSATKGRSSKKP